MSKTNYEKRKEKERKERKEKLASEKHFIKTLNDHEDKTTNERSGFNTYAKKEKAKP
jgi:hypothetical protein